MSTDFTGQMYPKKHSFNINIYFNPITQLVGPKKNILIILWWIGLANMVYHFQPIRLIKRYSDLITSLQIQTQETFKKTFCFIFFTVLLFLLITSNIMYNVHGSQFSHKSNLTIFCPLTSLHMQAQETFKKTFGFLSFYFMEHIENILHRRTFSYRSSKTIFWPPYVSAKSNWKRL